MVMRIPTLTSLGLRSLREISDGSVYISQNANLCYHHTVNWTQLFRGRRVRANVLGANRPLARCGEPERVRMSANGPAEFFLPIPSVNPSAVVCAVADGHVCDPLCSDAGCWGPGPDQCLSCRNYSRRGTCVGGCHFYSGSVRAHSFQMELDWLYKNKYMLSYQNPEGISRTWRRVRCLPSRV